MMWFYVAEEGFAHVLATRPQVRHQFLQHLGAHAWKLPWMARELEQPGERGRKANFKDFGLPDRPEISFVSE